MTKSFKKEGGSSSCCCRECCAPGGGLISRAKLVERSEAFAKGEWTKLLRASEICNEQAAIARQRQRRRRGMIWKVESFVPRTWCMLVSFVRHGKRWKMQWRQESDIGQVARCATQASTKGGVARDLGFQPPTLFQLHEKQFGRNLRSARRGVAGGPSGMTCEHLRPMLDEGKAIAAPLQVGREFGKSSRASGCGVNGEIWTTDGPFKTRRRGSRHCQWRRHSSVGGTNDCTTVGRSS